MKKTGYISCMILFAATAFSEVIYSNDFSEVAGTEAKETVPDTIIDTFVDASTVTLVTDGAGNLYSTDVSGNNVNYRFRLDPTPLNQDPSLSGVKYTVKMRVPSSAEWVGLGYHEVNKNGLLTSGANSGPWLQIGRTYITVRGGHSTDGTQEQFVNTFESGSTNTIEFTYHFDNTIDLAVNGGAVTNGMPIEHINEGGSTATNPVIGWLQAQFRQQDTIVNGGAFIDDLVVETIGYQPPLVGDVLYEDDFSGAAGTLAKDSVPEASPTGFFAKDYFMLLNGDGAMYETNNVSSAGFRFKLGTSPLSSDNSIEAVKMTAFIRTPTNDWIGIGFAENDQNGLLSSTANTGPWLQLNPTSVRLRGGHSTTGTDLLYNDPYAAGEEAVVELTYYPKTQTADLSVENSVLATNVSLVHVDESGVTNSPVLQWFSAQFRFQPEASEGGALLKHLRIETIEATEIFWFADWADDYELSGDDALRSADPDEDGMDNLLEYALGGNPGTNDAATVQPTAEMDNDNIIYVYQRRTDAATRGLDYGVILNDDLASGSWTNIGTSAEVNTGAGPSGFESVTNSIAATNLAGFVSLEVSED